MTNTWAAHGAGPTPDLLNAYDGIICDLDGVVRRGRAAVPGASEALEAAAGRGVRVVFTTNNASTPPAEVAAGLVTIGVAATEHDVVTSAQAGAAHLREVLGAGTAVLALGGPGVTLALAEQGLAPVPPGGRSADAILQGYGPALTVGDFADAARLVAEGVPWVATNVDLTLPVEWGSAPGNGAYVALLASATGRHPDAAVGKPSHRLYDLAVDRLSVDRNRILAVGDRLDTDIDGAASSGLHSAWVLTGVHAPSDLVAGVERARPTYVLTSLSDVLEPYAAVRAADTGWACGAYHCSVQGTGSSGPELVVTTDHLRGLEPIGASGEPPIEVVRAGLAAILDARDAGAFPVSALVEAARALDVR